MTEPGRLPPTHRAAELRPQLLALLEARPPLVVVTDFDGTVSPIDPDPLAARIEPLGRVALRRLAKIATLHPERLRLAVLSGRAARDVAARVRVGGVRYLGNHGLEWGSLARRGRVQELAVAGDSRLEPFVEPARRLGQAVAANVDAPWLFVEHKGPSVAFHFRQAPDPVAARARVLAALRAADEDSTVPPHGLVAFEGRRVIELRPADAGGKGVAIERLLEQERPGAVLVLGDDRTDAEAFRVVGAGRAAGRIAALALAVLGARETPPEILETADALLATPHEAARVLSLMARLVEREVASRPGS